MSGSEINCTLGQQSARSAFTLVTCYPTSSPEVGTHMNQGKKNETLNSDVTTIIENWGREIWAKPSKPKTPEDRKFRHEQLAKLLKDNDFSPEDISLKHVDQILKITVPIDNGSIDSQQMKGAAYWYLRQAFLMSSGEGKLISPLKKVS